jgi:hypothetical protein
VGGVRCLFLDFGCQNQISTVTHSSYGQHEYVFVSTMSDSIVNYIHCPAGEQAWDNPKWSNQPEFAVGCGRNSADQAHAIYAIDLNDKSYKQLVTGTELQQPCLLTGCPIFFHQDSIGRYNDPPNNNAQFICAAKLLLFWRIFDSLEVVTLGSSQGELGFNPAMFTGLKTLNMAFRGCCFYMQKNLILNYVIKQCPDIKCICSSLDIFWLNVANGGEWSPGIGSSKGYIYDSCHAFWPGGVTSDFKKIIRQIPYPYPWDTAYIQFFPVPSQNWGADTPSCFNTAWDTTDPHYQQNLADITAIANTLRTREIHWIMINFPKSPNYQRTGCYIDGGPSWQTALGIIQNMKELEGSNTFFHFYDANMDGNFDYVTEDFYDAVHLSEQGANKFSAKVDSIIHTILK